MKRSYLTLRLPTELAAALARWARTRGVPKSQVAREAVTQYLAGSAVSSERPAPVTARVVARRWPALPRLTPQEATDLEADIAAARAALPPVRSPWA